MQPSSNPNKEAAIAIANLGYRVIPCSAAKKPLVKEWQKTPVLPGWQVGGTWPGDAMPGLLTGEGLLVIDCDNRKGGPDGVPAFVDLCLKLGIDLGAMFVVESASGGRHLYFRTSGEYGNGRGGLPEGIDVRGKGGFVIAPGAVRLDGRGYIHVAGAWDAIPELPEPLAALLKQKTKPSPEPVAAPPAAPSERELACGQSALADEVAKLSAMKAGEGRNAALNAASHSLGTMCGSGWLDAQAVATALWDAAQANGYAAQDGAQAAQQTILSGLSAGAEKPRSPLPNEPVDEVGRQSVANILANYRAKQAGAPAIQAAKRAVRLVQGDQIQEQPITWLWDGFLPSGKLTLLAGAGGTGKSTIAFSLAATVTTAGLWPDGSRCAAEGNVLIWSTEDDPADTIKPRLMAVGANGRHYGVIAGVTNEAGQPETFNAARDMGSLREAVESIGGVSLLIIDPIVTAISGDMHKANDVRQSLQCIIDFAAEMKCAVLGITHFAKGTAGRNSAERVIGSQAFAALARMVLVAAKEEDSERRVFTRAKSNNSVDLGGFNYTIEPLTLNQGIVATRIVWGEALEGSSRSILGDIEGTNEERAPKMKAAKDFITSALSSGPLLSSELISRAREVGIAYITLQRAMTEMNLNKDKSAFDGG